MSCCLLAAVARAAGDDATGKGSPKGPGLEEIVVTAQKRAERLNKVPISITALGRTQMDKQGVRSIADIARLVPATSWATPTYRYAASSPTPAPRPPVSI